ncbi:MAG: hypothetical protein H6Q29_25 [Bacteroidetes bacterium]|nr:hypothetical protein [Bacteroidota bacterium]
MDLQTLDLVARDYVRAVLSLGVHDADYVDAYYGPPAWKAEVEAEKPDLNTIRDRASGILESLKALEGDMDQTSRSRVEYLKAQVRALLTRIRILEGARLAFDEESDLVYDAVAPHYDEGHFLKLLAALDGVIPGTGPAPERFDRFRAQFVIPIDRLDAVFSAAIDEARRRTQRWIPLPAGESFRLEYVKGKTWSGYNWFQGGSRSLIQINTDLPITIDRAIDLASHEGYPGHHVYNVVIERDLVLGHGWKEFSVYALFSPQSLIAEGTANYGVTMAFPAGERVEFERSRLFPLAGLDPESAGRYYEAHDLSLRLKYAGNEAARLYLDGEISRADAVEWLVTYALMSRQRAEQRTRFFDQYRSYVINYNLGQDMVEGYIAREAGSDHSEARRWEIFSRLLSSPQTPSRLSQAMEARLSSGYTPR